jgi:hypothetical protein
MASIKYQTTSIPRLGAIGGNPDFWETFLSDALDKYGVSSVTISSTYRTPSKQAEAMYNNATVLGVKSQLSLYNSKGDEVIKVFEACKKANMPKGDTLRAMEREIVRTKFNTGAHGKISPDFVCFDVPPATVIDKGKFERAMRSIASKFLTPANQGEPVYHVELAKGGELAKDVAGKSVPLVSLFIVGGIAWFLYKTFVETRGTPL